ncbi:ATP-binding protein [Blautia hominis]|uniref:ATP-binding protein n=1 Tax=Blautia hominis TaxID=2025493 RepID=A0ABQ0BFS7_9FIRM
MNSTMLGVQFLLSFLECFLGWKFYELIFKEKIGKKSYYIISVTYLLIVSCVLGLNRIIRLYSVIVILFYIIMTATFLKVVYRIKMLNCIIYSILYFLTIALIDIFIIFIFGIILGDAKFGVTIGRQLSWKRIIVLAITRISMFLIFSQIKKNYNIKTIKYNKVALGISILEVVGVLYFQMVYSQGDITQLASKWFGFLIVTAFIIFIIIILTMYRNIKEKNERIIIENQYFEFNYNNIYKNYKDSEKILHDFKTHIFILQNMIEKDEKSKAIEYINGIKKPIIGLENKIWIGNTIIDMILNYKFAEAYQNNIEITYAVERIQLENLTIKEGELGIVLDNILSNAIEANNKLKGKEKVINLSVKCINEMIIITCKNSFDPSSLMYEEGKLQSMKNGALHGIGLQSIENIVEKYNGFMKLNHDDKFFFIGITLSS